MIPLSEIKEKAREHGVPISTIERDYVQGWLLRSLSGNNKMVLKGGTGIRKAYFPDYRFSDDLDFTLLKDIDAEGISDMMEKAISDCGRRSGISFSGTSKLIENENGFKTDVYFRITQRGNGKTRIKMDITKPENEKVMLPIKKKEVIHAYSDFLHARIEIYSLEEIFAEKIRSIFQRTRPRDLYDLWHLWDRADIQKAISILPGKFKARDIMPDLIDLRRRKDDFKNAWKNSLRHQLRELPDFDVVFENILGNTKTIINGSSS